MRNHLIAGAVLFAACTPSNGQSQPESAVAQGAANTAFAPAFEHQTRAPAVDSNVEIAVAPIARGLVEPWSIAFLPDGRLLVSERPGRLRIVTREGEVSAPVEGLPPVDARNQGGLLGLAVSPAFDADRLIYWSYAEPRGQGRNGTSVARGRLAADGSRVDNVQVIFRQTPPWESYGHFGSVLVFDGSGHLFITLGDRQRDDSRGLAQALNGHIGKVVRITPDGAAPADNPFVDVAGARPEIWSYGHRNVQGADLHPQTGELWTVEHGPQGGDEINVTRAGRNYGWPIISYGEEYDGRPVNEGVTAREGMEQPLYYWDPVIAPGDMDFYRGSLFPWRGDLLIAGLRAQSLVRLVFDGERVTGEERFNLGIGRIRDVEESEDGALWVITDEEEGGLYRLTPRR